MSLRRIAGIAGLGYVAGAAIENIEILEVPTLDSPVADIRGYYDDQAFGVVTTLAGALSLLSYCLFALALFRLLRDREGPERRWSTVALAGGLGAAAVATAGLVAGAILVLNGDGLSDGRVGDLFDLNLRSRLVSGVLAAAFLFGLGIAALPTAALPRRLAGLACALAFPLALGPLAAITADETLELAVKIAFGLQALWILVAGLWLALGDEIGAVMFARRVAFLLLALAAVLVGVAMLAAPGATEKYFAWALGPEPLAAFAGGVYVGAAVVYGVGLPRSWPEVRGLVAGAVVLSVSVLLITLTHLDQFDLDRLQAWAWIVLFAGFSLVTAGLLMLGSAERGEAEAALAPSSRAVLVAVAAAMGALALALWTDPTRLSGASPVDLSPLGGRFAGSWVALLAVLAGWAAVRNRTAEARLSILALVALPAGALLAALRTISDLEPAGAAAAYVAALGLLLACGVGLLQRSRLGE